MKKTPKQLKWYHVVVVFTNGRFIELATMSRLEANTVASTLAKTASQLSNGTVTKSDLIITEQKSLAAPGFLKLVVGDMPKATVPTPAQATVDPFMAKLEDKFMYSLLWATKMEHRFLTDPAGDEEALSEARRVVAYLLSELHRAGRPNIETEAPYQRYRDVIANAVAAYTVNTNNWHADAANVAEAQDRVDVKRAQRLAMSADSGDVAQADQFFREREASRNERLRQHQAEADRRLREVSDERIEEEIAWAYKNAGREDVFTDVASEMPKPPDMVLPYLLRERSRRRIERNKMLDDAARKRVQNLNRENVADAQRSLDRPVMPVGQRMPIGMNPVRFDRETAAQVQTKFNAKDAFGQPIMNKRWVDSHSHYIAEAYASALINGDYSGLDYEDDDGGTDRARFEAWRKRNSTPAGGSWDVADGDSIFTTDEVTGLKAMCVNAIYYYEVH